jgi:hypothetical protein
MVLDLWKKFYPQPIRRIRATVNHWMTALHTYPGTGIDVLTWSIEQGESQVNRSIFRKPRKNILLGTGTACAVLQ